MDKKQLVIDYCLKELHTSQEEAERLYAKVSKHSDIFVEFLKWLESRSFNDDFTVGGYSSRKIFELAPFMNGIGVYNFMVTLRDNPDAAKEYIETGFRVL